MDGVHGQAHVHSSREARTGDGRSAGFQALDVHSGPDVGGAQFMHLRPHSQQHLGFAQDTSGLHLHGSADSGGQLAGWGLHQPGMARGHALASAGGIASPARSASPVPRMTQQQKQVQALRHRHAVRYKEYEEGDAW
eukprot:CAMPEP_0202875008 /NCGR_PEP_ID=MMETSP1391-20130828/26453_1 /ASSEMBLY_ACC=CAM_ASM_000867 /TAXON_ID=1034604 /ORGANISM="Chlamydomonas leiostraca, Strain SAG 11-49" /LENGTH=136 /DNA_ID=CAMNT_0049556589 /DNA_START=13 /DNA_END=423 /DNA_ORIENTATION=-